MLFIHSRVSSFLPFFPPQFTIPSSRSPVHTVCNVVGLVAAAMRDAKSERKKDRLLDYILLEFKWLIMVHADLCSRCTMCGELFFSLSLSLNDDENYDKEKATTFLLVLLLFLSFLFSLFIIMIFRVVFLLRSSIGFHFQFLSSFFTSALSLSLSLERSCYCCFSTIYDRFAIDMKIKNSRELKRTYFCCWVVREVECWSWANSNQSQQVTRSQVKSKSHWTESDFIIVTEMLCVAFVDRWHEKISSCVNYRFCRCLFIEMLQIFQVLPFKQALHSPFSVTSSKDLSTQTQDSRLNSAKVTPLSHFILFIIKVSLSELWRNEEILFEYKFLNRVFISSLSLFFLFIYFYIFVLLFFSLKKYKLNQSRLGHLIHTIIIFHLMKIFFFIFAAVNEFNELIFISELTHS